jgi:hypothetical protein
MQLFIYIDGHGLIEFWDRVGRVNSEILLGINGLMMLIKWDIVIAYKNLHISSF